MDTLLPGHAHRSSSDRLLNNYLSSQKHLSTSLLTLLSHSHSSSSSLLAYVTSSPGIPYTVRRSVQHAAFEGPIDISNLHPYEEEDISGGSSWNNYLASLETFRRDLKDVHLLEEELSQVKRDREILITRLIKATKSRPSSKDLAALASASVSSPPTSRTGGGFSSSSSTMSFESEGSGTTAGGGKRSKRANKLAEAQAEVLGCEEHLRGLEVQLEGERTKVMKHGLMERFRAMEDVARMWLRQARLGINELERSNGMQPDGMLNPNAYELDSNGSLAPSQSASQVGVNPAAVGDSVSAPSLGKAMVTPRRDQRNGYHGGSVTGSIAEEDENSSGSDEAPVGGTRRFVVHENHPAQGGRSGAGVAAAAVSAAPPSTNGTITNRHSVGPVLGVPSITNMPKPRRANSIDNYTGVAQPRRRTQSEVGVGYRSPTAQAAARRHSLKRTFSGDRHSDGSSIRSARKKGGFFRSIARLFKSQPGAKSGGSIRGGSVRGGGGGRRGDDSPPLTHRSSGGWQTRTDDNIKRVGSLMGGRGTARGDDSSDSDDDVGGRNLVAITNMGHDKWSVDKIGLIPATPASKKVTRSDLGSSSKSRSDSTSTITPATKGKAAGASNLVRSQSTATVSKRTRQGSISRAPGRTHGSIVGAPVSIASVLEKGSVVSKSSTITGNKKSIGGETAAAKAPASKPLMEVPKAPRSQVTPQMYTVSAPPRITENLLQSPPPLQQPALPTSTLSATARSGGGGGSQIAKSPSANGVAGMALGKPVTSTATPHSDHADDTDDDDIPHRPTTPLPPSKSLSPPARSSLRAPSPMPSYIVSAPGSVVPEAKHEESVMAGSTPSENVKGNTYAPTITTDGESVYESAAEDPGSDEERVRATKAMDQEDASSEASDDTADPSKYRVVENDRGPPLVPVEAVMPATEPSLTPVQEKSEPKMDMPVAPPPGSEAAPGLERRKSVRMNIPDSPAIPESPNKDSPILANGHVNGESTWTSRIGTRRDSSDEEDNSAYAKAKKSLTNSTRRFGGLGQSPVKNPKSKKRNVA